MFQLFSVPAINRIFYLFKHSEAFESAKNNNKSALSIFVSPKRTYRYSQIVDLENREVYNFLKFYVELLLSFVYPFMLKS